MRLHLSDWHAPGALRRWQKNQSIVAQLLPGALATAPITSSRCAVNHRTIMKSFCLFSITSFGLCLAIRGFDQTLSAPVILAVAVVAVLFTWAVGESNRQFPALTSEKPIRPSRSEQERVKEYRPPRRHAA
jgi:hypothetical protein